MVNERALLWACQGEQVVAVLSEPAIPTSNLGVLVVVGGPQYRAGSHRQFVQLARSVATAGHVALRFDVRGMGDSTGDLRSFESLDEDIACAIDALHREVPAVMRVVLVGLCDGASAVWMYTAGRSDPRVAGLCLLNPWLRSPDTLARTHAKHYYLRRLGQGEFWRKLLRGGVGARALGEFLRALRSLVGLPSTHREASRPADFRARMLRGCQLFDGRTLLILSGDDLTACEFSDSVAMHSNWREAMGRSGFKTLHLPGADHTLSKGEHRQAFESAFVEWLQSPDWTTHDW